MHARIREGTWSQTAVPTPRCSDPTAAGLVFVYVSSSIRPFSHGCIRTGPEACNASDPDANGMGTKWCGAVSRDVLLALTLPNPYSLLALLASMLPGVRCCVAQRAILIVGINAPLDSDAPAQWVPASLKSAPSTLQDQWLCVLVSTRSARTKACHRLGRHMRLPRSL